MTSLAENIRRYRDAAGLTQEQAAHRIGVTMMAWSRWERAERTPTVPTLQRIADLLQTTPSKLLEESTK